MAQQLENPVTFVFIGPLAGKSGVYGGFEFKDGKLTVEKDDEQKVAAIVSRYYNAHPEHKLEAAQKAYDEQQAAAKPAPAKPAAPAKEPAKEPAK